MKWIGLAAATVLVTACSEDPHVQNSALAGGAISAAKGCNDVGGCGGPDHRLYYDRLADRCYRENGEPRGWSQAPSRPQGEGADRSLGPPRSLHHRD